MRLLLVATGITPDGQRTILGVSVSLSEAEVALARLPGLAANARAAWRAADCQRRPPGDQGCLAVAASPACAGNAASFTWPRTCWPTCRRAFPQGRGQRVASCGGGLQRPESLAERPTGCWRWRSRSTSSRGAQACRLAGRQRAPMVRRCSTSRRTSPATSALNNMLERRLNREIKRRTRVATLFPNEEASLLPPGHCGADGNG